MIQWALKLTHPSTPDVARGCGLGLGGMLRMDEVAVVRHRVLVEGASRRAVAESPVKRYLADAPVGVRSRPAHASGA